MYSKSSVNSHVIISLYVDNMLIFGSIIHVINETMKDPGETNFILGKKIAKTCDSIFLDQSHYVEKILRKCNCHDYKSVATLFDSNVHLFLVNNENEIFN